MDTIIKFWFPNSNFQKFWFDKSKDEYITENYKSILLEELNKEIKLEDFKILDFLKYIILYDQLSRNIFRENKENVYFKECNNRALKISKYFIMHHFKYNMNFNYISFILLPLRHSKKQENYNLIFEILNNIKNNDIIYRNIVTNKTIFNKFCKATFRDVELYKLSKSSFMEQEI